MEATITVGKSIRELIRERGLQKPLAVGYVFVANLPLPDKSVSPNARCHWAVKSRAAKTMRALACAEGQKSLWRFACPVITAIFYGKTKRRRDRDNAIGSLKAYCDGLADAGLFENDSLVTWDSVEFDIDKENPHLTLFISEHDDVLRTPNPGDTDDVHGYKTPDRN